MVVLPPGTILQLRYLRERLRRLPAGRFIEVGPGSGEVTRVLLEMGWTGTALDIEPYSVEALRDRFAGEILSGRLRSENLDFVKSPDDFSADLVISCMVMEHMEDPQQSAFLDRAATCLGRSGTMIGLVPASPAHWGIEDDIAGHCRRYTRQSLRAFLESRGWQLTHLAGLTYPVSNLLLPLSNYLVGRAERAKLALTAEERTKLSGRRRVAYKTHFPSLAALLLNEVTLYPLHLLQKALCGTEAALVLYFEAQPPGTARVAPAADRLSASN